MNITICERCLLLALLSHVCKIPVERHYSRDIEQRRYSIQLEVNQCHFSDVTRLPPTQAMYASMPADVGFLEAALQVRVGVRILTGLGELFSSSIRNSFNWERLNVDKMLWNYTVLNMWDPNF